MSTKASGNSALLIKGGVVILVVVIAAVVLFGVSFKGELPFIGDVEISKAQEALTTTPGTKIAATIDLPPTGSEVSERIRLSGTVSSLLPNDSHLWVVLRNNNLLWPKNPEAFIVGETWQTTISEAGQGSFLLVLYLVDAEGHKFIQKWLKNGAATGHFPGLPKIPGQALASVEVVRL